MPQPTRAGAASAGPAAPTPPATPTETPATRLLGIVTRFLIPAIGRWLYARAATGALPANATAIGLAQAYIQSLVRRFAKLEAKYLAGTLIHRPRGARAEAPSKTPRKPGRYALIPRRWGWLTREVPECAWHGAGPLLDILQRPDTLAMIAAHPVQTGRILRPLCRLLLGRTHLPPILALPPRPKRARPPPAPKPRTPKPRAPKPRALPAPTPSPWTPQRGDLTRILWGSPAPPQSKKSA